MILRFFSVLLVGVCALYCTGYSQAGSSPHTESVKAIVEEHFDEVDSLYRHLHANPELSWQEEETAGRIAAELEQLGFTVTTRVGGYGIVGVFENGESPVVMVRSDMDALPIEEETGAEFASRQTAISEDGERVPVMHACGHDMHMAVMVGTAELSRKYRSSSMASDR